MQITSKHEILGDYMHEITDLLQLSKRAMNAKSEALRDALLEAIADEHIDLIHRTSERLKLAALLENSNDDIDQAACIKH